MEVRNRKDIYNAKVVGADLIILHYTTFLGIAKVAGLMPFGNPNESVFSFIRELQPIETTIPVIAGICGTEPCRNQTTFLQKLKLAGIDGVQNFPSVGYIDGVYRQNLEAVNLGYERECSLIERGVGEGLVCFPLVFNEKEAIAMAKTGCKVLIYSMGLRIHSNKQIANEEIDEFWCAVENTARIVKEKYPQIMMLVYTENHLYLETMINRLSQDGTAVDGVYNCLTV